VFVDVLRHGGFRKRYFNESRMSSCSDDSRNSAGRFRFSLMDAFSSSARRGRSRSLGILDRIESWNRKARSSAETRQSGIFADPNGSSTVNGGEEPDCMGFETVTFRLVTFVTQYTTWSGVARRATPASDPGFLIGF